jgi:DnaJ-domain-containing protein 1
VRDKNEYRPRRGERSSPDFDARAHRRQEDSQQDGGSSWDRYTAMRRRQSRRVDRSVPDYYAFLGVERTATKEQLERVYRRYVSTIHPDRFFNDPLRRDLAQEMLKELNDVMQVLRDPERRAQYDAALAGNILPMMPLTSRLREPRQRT